ncbi:MAG: phosphate ABC transporter permease PstA [Candidatus Gallimonas sp.]
MEKIRNKRAAGKISGVRLKEGFAKYVFLVCALTSVVAVFGIIAFILYASVPAFREAGFFQFLFGTDWAPMQGKFGILTMIVNSVIVTLGSILLGGTVGVFTAIYLVFWCPDRFHLRYGGKNKFLLRLVRVLNKINLRTIFDQVIKILAGIPSIVYGIFGLGVIVPLLAMTNSNGVGEGILACSLLLAIMIIPTVTSLSKNALEAVPESYFEGALALGNTKAQAVFRVVFPAARSGILSALILGVGRAIGEAMAVIWVSGNRALFPTGLFSYIRPLTVNIVLEMGYATGVHKSALIATGLVLLVLVLLIILSMNFVPKEYKGKKGTMELCPNPSERVVYRKKGKIAAALKVVSMVCAAIVLICLAIVMGYILVRGIGCFTSEFLFGAQRKSVPTFAPALFATLELIAITLAIALPLGIGAAIFLVEYAKPGSRAVKVVRAFIDTLSGVPSIVFGLFGNIVFVTAFGIGKSVLSGALTMVIVVLPTIIRSTEESLLAVPVSLREASYGLGASKVRTIFKVVLPSAFPGIATASILAIGRIIGESAALVFTMGTLFTFTGSPLDGGSSLSVLLYTCANEGYFMDQAYCLAVILLAFTLALNLIVYFIQRRVQRKQKR